MKRRCITIDAELDDWLVATARARRQPVSGIVQLALLAQIPPPAVMQPAADCPAAVVDVTGSGARQGAPQPSGPSFSSPLETAGQSGTAAGGACAGTAADSFSPTAGEDCR